MMTVGELREKLRTLPEDMPVEICAMRTGEDLDVSHAGVYDEADSPEDAVFLLEH